MKTTLLEFLCCPRCRATGLAVEGGGDGEVLEGRLVCSCGAAFPISGGVPRFTGELEEGKRETAECFGPEWHRFDDLGESFERSLLEEFIHPVDPDVFSGATVLEGGCGAGRNLRRIAEYGAKTVIGVDISSSVEVAYRKTQDMENVHVIQADLLDIPLAGPVDAAFTAGVLHHLPEPRKGFEAMHGHARPGGAVLNTVYSLEGNEWIVRFVNPLRLGITRKLSPRLLHAVSLALAIPSWVVLLCIYKPANEWRGLGWLKRLLVYNDFAYLFVRLGFRSLVTQIYDQLGAPTAFFLSRGELESWVEGVELEKPVFFWRNKNCWNFVGNKRGK